jgi:hypothetical protein
LCDCNGCCAEFDGDNTIENSGQFGKRVALVVKRIGKVLLGFLLVFSKVWNIFFGLILLIFIFTFYNLIWPILYPTISLYIH